MISQLLSLLALTLMAVFAASAFGKLAYWEDTLAWLAKLLNGLLSPWLKPAAALVVVLEGAILIALAVSVMAGGLLAALWVAGASGVLWNARKA